MASVHSKILLVEGDEDKRVIPELIEANGIDWGKSPKEAVVFIKSCNGVENLLDKKQINTELKASDLQILGIIVDADESPRARWQRVRQCLIENFPGVPSELPDTGLIASNTDGIKVGVWMMPDNKERGMLETFLHFLLPENNKNLWRHAEDALNYATKSGAPYKAAHRDKAKIHTWLAWQNPPGRQLHNALTEKILNPQSEYSVPFMTWFRELFEIE